MLFLGGRYCGAGAGRACTGSEREGSGWDRASTCLIVIVVIVAACTFRDYGLTWDEDVHNWYGDFVLDYYLSFFADRTALHWSDLINYGAAFDTIAAALNRFSPVGVYETRHLLNALVGVVGLVGCRKLGAALGGPRAGFIAVLFLVLTPNYYGQMFNNPKDIPFAVGMVWAFYYLVRLIPHLPAPPWRLVVKFAIAAGLTLGIRVGGLLLLAYLAMLLGLDAIWRGFAERSIRPAVAAGWRSLWRVLLPACVIAYPVMLLFWPWAQIDPIDNPLKALQFFSHQTFPFGRSELFEGQSFPATQLPWTYLPTHIALSLPELVLLLALGAPIAAFAALQHSGWRPRREEALALAILGVGILFPVCYAIAIRAVLFDGMRHFMFVLPLIAVVAALTADHVLAWFEGRPSRRPVFAALGLYGALHVWTMVVLHPDQYIYYNAFVGGVEGAQHKFKLDYWANSYAEAVRGLEDYLRGQYGADFEEREFTIAVCGPLNSAKYYFPPNFRLTRKLSEAEFFIGYTKDNCDRSPGRPVYRVERLGALLSVVLDRRQILAEQRAPWRTGWGPATAVP
jgi:hypothetical protein